MSTTQHIKPAIKAADVTGPRGQHRV